MMVRSTGIEDSQTVANAGGNVSIAYVSSTPKAIEVAMGEVVASYFGVQSLKNRIVGGENIAEAPLCIPVLIQQLVGETVGGTSIKSNIPVSGVAFTTNPSLSAPNFPITEINASYGHGEGVVANKVTADRYYVTYSRVHAEKINIFPMVYKKLIRLVPYYDIKSQLHELKVHSNEKELIEGSCLSETQLKHLHLVLNKIEKEYGQPIDVEFIVRNSIVYIVQARPAMRCTLSPSYCAFEKMSEDQRKEFFQITTLVPAKAQAIVITHPSEILVANSLDEADQDSRSATCKAVIVGTWASSLSHAAVNFTSHGIPCLYVPDINKVKQLLSTVSFSTPLIIDVQRRMTRVWKGESIQLNNIIIEGWFEHPVECAISLMAASPRPLFSFSILPQDAKLITLLEQCKKVSEPVHRKEIVTIITERMRNYLRLTERRIAHI
jgi:phosphoenolpyruvate synthase/pyruvate phosphate dikinase